MRNLSLRQIEAFLAVGEKLSFSRGAEAMNITQSAFSQLIRELESGLGVRLFDRTTRRVKITDSGVVLLRKMKRGMVEINDACEEARAIARVEHGHLSVATLPSLAIGVVIKVLEAMRRSHPGITFNISEDYNGALIERVALGDADFALCARSTMADDLDFTLLFHDELVAVMGQALAKGLPRPLPWSTLEGYPLIMMPHNSSTREQIATALAHHRVTNPVKYDVATMFTALSMARAGFGATFIPLRTLTEVNMDGLTWLPIEAPAPSRPIGICRRKDRTPSPAMWKFQELLKSHAISGAPVPGP